MSTTSSPTYASVSGPAISANTATVIAVTFAPTYSAIETGRDR